MFKMRKHIAIYLALMVVALQTGCDKANTYETANDMLGGEWNVTSYLVNGEEMMGDFVGSFELVFDNSRPEGGEAHWTVMEKFSTLTSYTDTYQIVNDARAIAFNGDVLEFRFEDGELLMSGVFEGKAMQLVCQRN